MGGISMISGARSALVSGGEAWDLFRLESLAARYPIERLPFCLRVFLENLLRHDARGEAVAAVAGWAETRRSGPETSFMPARVLMQDFTGVPAVVDLAAMREAVGRLGGDPRRINPLVPVDLVVDHSVQVDRYGDDEAFACNARLEYERNRERYAFLKWGQKAFANLSVVPPESGIVHQVNLEHLARVVWTREEDGRRLAYPDTLVGTDSHTTMTNGLGVLSWGVGGIEAEAVMLGQPIAMLVPEVVGVRLTGRLPEGVTATDAVLTLTALLRRKGVVEKFVEFYGSGVGSLAVADRATLANMAPEYGATVGFFPVDSQTLDYLALTGKPEAHIRLVEDYCREQGLFRTDSASEPQFSDTVELDLAAVRPSIAGPRRPQDLVLLAEAGGAWEKSLQGFLKGVPEAQPKVRIQVESGDRRGELGHGSVVIAAITSCTNTANPAAMIGAGLLAQKAVARGLKSAPWVKTSLAPGSKVVMDYYREAGLIEPLARLGFQLVGFGCTTCIGNSGPLEPAVVEAIKRNKLVVAAVLSGNRNFEGRINPHVKASFLASPMLVVAYALAGRVGIDLTTEPLGRDAEGRPVLLRDIWPTDAEIAQTVRRAVKKEFFASEYASIGEGDERWRALAAPGGDLYAWDNASTYVRRPPYFEGWDGGPRPVTDIRGARALAWFADSVTTDHISPAGDISQGSPAGCYLQERGVQPSDFNSYGSRRGNHEVMMRGAFANIRIRNLLLPGSEGPETLHLPDGQRLPIFDAALRYQKEGVPLVVLAGREYGCGSSRDWAAKGPALLGVRAVLAVGFERIHRSNLVGMGILPLQFCDGQDAASLGLTGRELFDVSGFAAGLKPRQRVTVDVARPDGGRGSFEMVARIDTPAEVEYYRWGGILPYVLSRLMRP
ncbi:MAG: aconitate hydratase AcnA [Elusimicrobia bacterium]|nr:aconitate hydratase AcnA [Elusimicrobiota bacterium]